MISGHSAVVARIVRDDEVASSNLAAPIKNFMTKKYLTPEKLASLKKELEYLKTVKRKEIAERLKHAISFGDLSENAAYTEAKEAQADLENRIVKLEELIKNATIIKKTKETHWVQIGSIVKVISEDGKEREFQIVGVEEIDLNKGKISYQSPLGKALLNKPEGAIIEVETPQGKAKYKIIEIK